MKDDVTNAAKHHPSVEALLQHFELVDAESLCHPLDIQYRDFAHQVADNCEGSEGTVALRKLLESRDAAFRALSCDG